MHKDFADWHRAAEIEPKAEELESRWSVIEGLGKKRSNDTALDWVRLLLGKPTKSSGFLASFTQAFKGKDSTFPMQDNELLLKVLAGAATVNLLEKKPTELSNTVALATVCSHCCNLVAPVIPVPILGVAQDYLFSEGQRIRAIDETQLEEIGSTMDETLKPVADYMKNGDVVNAGPLFSKLFEKLAKAVQDLGKMVKNVQEETNMLWWVMGEYSRDHEKELCELELPAASLVAGIELADLTKTLPAPVASLALLDKILASGRESPLLPVTIKDAINSFPRDWRTDFVKLIDPRLEDFCPIHTAAKKSLETNDTTHWPSSFKSMFKVSPTKKCSALSLAHQIYIERLLLRAVELSA